jgi:hypothetical protein
VEKGFEVALELFEDLLLAEVLDGVAAGGDTEVEAEDRIFDEAGYGGVEGGGVFGGDNEAAAFDDVGYLGVGVGGGDDGAAAREHAGELGGHDEVGGSGSLGEEVDVGCVEEVVEALNWLEREQRYVGMVGDEGFELRAEGSVAAEEEVDARVVFEGLRKWGQEFEALFCAHIAGVEKDDFVFEVEFAAEGVGCGAMLRVDGFDVDPVGEEDGV